MDLASFPVKSAFIIPAFHTVIDNPVTILVTSTLVLNMTLGVSCT